MVDLDGPWGWRAIEPVTLFAVFAKLESYGTMTWAEIFTNDRTGCHDVPVSDICAEAQARLLDIRRADLDFLTSLRITGQRRVWGVRQRHILRVLWWDPLHTVYPVA
jgi:hypothetical protein